MSTAGQGQQDHLTWDYLVLEGFGRFGGVVRLVLGHGANVLVAPNESGKSTLAAAVPAVLFGLAGSVDPGAFSEGRFRSWQRSRAFRGALAFSRQGVQYLIERDFAGRSVRLLRRAEQGTGWRALADELHHAGAHRRGRSYSTTMTGLVGIADRTILERTFYLTQPLPGASELDSSVQGLLSGGGGAFAQALDHLHTQLRLITRHTAALGVTPRDAHNDRLLESTQRELAELATQVAEQRQMVDAMEGLQLGLAEARAAESAARAELGSVHRLAEAWQRWTSYRTAYEMSLAAQLAAGKALREAKEAAVQLAAARSAAAQYPEMAGISKDAATRLARLVSVEAEVEQLQARRATLESEMGQRLGRAAIIEDESQRYPQAVREQPELLSWYDRLTAAVTAGEATRRRYLELALAHRQAAAALAAAGDWSAVAAWPVGEVRRLHQAAEMLARRWGRLLATQSELSTIDAEWSEHYPSIDRSTAGSQLDDWAAAVIRLEALRDRGEQLEQLLEAAPDLAELANPQATLATVEQLISIRATASKSRRGHVAVARPAAVRWAFVGGLAGFASWYFAGRPWSVGGAILLAVLGATAGVLLAASQRRAAAPDGPDLSAVPAGWIEQDLAALRASAQRLHDYLARHRAIDADSLAREVVEAEAALARDLLAPGDARDRLAALRRLSWRRQTVQERAAAELEQLGMPSSGLGDLSQVGWADGVDLTDLRADPGPALAALAEFKGVRVRQVGQLIAWLSDLDDDWWQATAAQAADWERLAREVADLDRRLTGLGDTSATGRAGNGKVSGTGDLGSPAASTDHEIDQLRQAIVPFDEHTAREELSAQIASWRRLQEDLALLRQALHRDETDMADLEARLASATGEAQGIRGAELAELLRAVGGDCQAAEERLRNGLEVMAEVARLEQRLSGAMQSQGVEDLEQLELRQLHQDNRVIAASQAWDKLLEEHPALPPREALDDSERIDRMAAAVNERREGAQARLEAASTTAADLTRQLARAEGLGPPLNLVHAVQQITALKRRCAELTAEAGAIALAHQELGVALSEYQGVYREQLRAAATGYFAAFTGSATQRVDLDDGFAVSVELAVPGDAVTRRTVPVSLSQGAQDQLLVALRLAIADLLTGRVSLPLVFDDPFLTFDDRRLQAMRRTFTTVSENRQTLLLTHRSELAAWGRAVTIEHLASWPDWEGAGDVS